MAGLPQNAMERMTPRNLAQLTLAILGAFLTARMSIIIMPLDGVAITRMIVRMDHSLVAIPFFLTMNPYRDTLPVLLGVQPDILMLASVNQSLRVQ